MMKDVIDYKEILIELNELNFLFALDTAILIDQEYQKSLDTYISSELYGTCHFDLIIEYDFNDPMYEEKEAYFHRKIETLKLLKNLSVLDEYTINGDHDDVLPLANVTINVDNFNQFKKSIRAIYLEKYSERHPVKADFGCFLTHFGNDPINVKPLIDKLQQNSLLSRRELLVQKEAELQAKKENPDKALYEITFTLNNEILLNDLVRIGKPNLNSENGKIFPFLFEKPNQTFTKKKIEEHLGHSIGKDFHKIVENWGFTGDLRKTFFQVSKDAILFRNHIKKSDFEKLGIPPLRIIPK